MTTADYTEKILNGKYRVLQLLGEGGMGAVYLGEHSVIGKPVAIKFLHAELSAREEVVKRFYREAQAAAAVRHPNIIDVIDVGVSEEGDPYLVMEYLEGEGLGDRLEKHGVIDLPSACGILEATLVALEAAHEKGIVHRDLKPDNIFLVHQKGETPGVKLIDFGISKFTSMNDQTKLTRDGSMLGTPAYMSPEQAKGLDEVDKRTDLYAVGVIMYQMLTGDLPYCGANYNELLVNVLTTEPRDPAAVNPSFPEEARPVIEKALSKDADDRHQSAREMLEEIRRLTTLDERVRHLTVLGGQLDTRGHATGDLGKSQVEVGATRLASEVFQKMMDEHSPLAAPRPKGWGARVLAHPVAVRIEKGMIRIGDRLSLIPGFSTVARPLSRVRRNPYWKGITGTLVAGAIVLLFVRSCSGEEDSITITVEGAPKGAKIYYDDSLVPVNPFKVERGETLVPLWVDFPGRRKTFKFSVIPSEDRVIDLNDKESQVTQEAEPEETEAKTPEKGSEPKDAPAAENRQAEEKKRAEKREPAEKDATKNSTKNSKKDSKQPDQNSASSETKKTKKRKQSARWPWQRR